MAPPKKKTYEERQYNLTEVEMQALILKAKKGDGAAQLILLDTFENFLSPYIQLLYHGKYNLTNYVMRRFLSLFVPDPNVRFFLLRNKLNPGGIKQLNDVVRGLVGMVQRYCLAGETEIITSDGVKPISSLVGQTVSILNGNSNGAWQSAKISSFGIQPLMRLTVKRCQQIKTIYATPEHRWYVKNSDRRLEETTITLKPGDKLSSIFGHLPGNIEPSPYGIGAGIVFGDGTVPKHLGSSAKALLYGEKDAVLLKWFPLCKTRTIHVGKDCLVEGTEVTGLPRAWKEAPSLSEATDYLYGWLAGYFAADGTISTQGSPSITSYDYWRVKVARDVAYKLGIPTLGISSWTGPHGFRDGDKTAYKLCFPVGALRDDFFLIPAHQIRNRPRTRLRVEILPDWEVVSVEKTDRTEEVFCATVEGARSFVLADNILTGNCDIEDVEQTVKMAFLECVNVYQPKESAAGPVPFSGYLYAYFFFVLKKKVDALLIDQLGRKTFPLLEGDPSDFDDEEEARQPGFPAPPTPGAEELAHRDEIDEYWVAGDLATGAFASLTPQERQLLRWRYVDGERSSDIAHRITEHPNTTREHLSRIRTKIREYLAEQEEV